MAVQFSAMQHVPTTTYFPSVSPRSLPSAESHDDDVNVLNPSRCCSWNVIFWLIFFVSFPKWPISGKRTNWRETVVAVVRYTVWFVIVPHIHWYSRHRTNVQIQEPPGSSAIDNGYREVSVSGRMSPDNRTGRKSWRFRTGDIMSHSVVDSSKNSEWKHCLQTAPFFFKDTSTGWSMFTWNSRWSVLASSQNVKTLASFKTSWCSWSTCNYLT